MNLHRLTRASDYEVADWLEKELDLTKNQKYRLHEYEIIRFSPFKFYKSRQKEKARVLWRLTIIFFALYLAVLFIGLPFTFIFTGHWGYGRTFYDKFHAPWMAKIGL